MDTKAAITPLWRTNRAFRAFWLGVHKRIAKPIDWALLPPHANIGGIPLSGVCLFNGGTQRFTIQLPTLPADDARLCAHELYHAALASEGYFPPVTHNENEINSGVSALAELLQKPMIVRALAQHGIAHPINMAKWDHDLPDQPGELDRLVCAWFYLADELAFQADTGSTPAAIADRFQRARPRTWQVVDYTRRLIDRIGYETPAQHDRIYKTLIKHYRLEGILRL